MRLRIAYVLAAVCLWLAGTLSAYGADVTVDCNKKKTITEALAGLSKQGPNTIHVSGTCNEAVTIDGYEDLTVIGNPGASINDPTPSDLEDNDVVDISQSRNVTVQGFTINGGASGVACFQFSVCNLRELLVQGQSSTGVIFSRGSGFADNITIQNTLFTGFQAANSSNVILGSNLFGTPGTTTIQNNGTEENGGAGVVANHGSNLTLFGTTIQGHAFGDGVNVGFASFMRILGTNTITGNTGNGVSVGPSSVLRIQAGSPDVNTITGNGGNGVAVSHLSFLRIQGQRVISGNGAPDVNCQVTTAKTQGVGDSSNPNLGGGTTNCTEPAP